jgi:hypothetical protein
MVSFSDLVAAGADTLASAQPLSWGSVLAMLGGEVLKLLNARKTDVVFAGAELAVIFDVGAKIFEDLLSHNLS